MVIGPWLLSIQHISDGQFAVDWLQHDFLAKIFQGQESHGAPPGTYFVLTPFLLWPVSWLLIPKAWLGLMSLDPINQRLRRFLFGWLIPCWILFEIVPTKLPHYVLPLIPALCLLGGIGFDKGLNQETPAIAASKWPERIGSLAWISTTLLISAGIPAVSLWASGTLHWAAIGVSLTGIATLGLASRLKNNIQQ
jgi:4-amino-4-deoxy-L-arabinose transferase-like glycosyltransferase